MIDGPAVTPPDGWVRVEIPPPPVTNVSGVTVDEWAAWEAPAGTQAAPGRVVVGCLGVELDTWTDEATPLAIERLQATTRSVAAQLDPATVLRALREERTPTMTAQELNRVDDAAIVARTFLGFTRPSPGTSPRIEGCLVVCAPATAECEATLAKAIPPAFVPPPPASVVLRSVVYGVHHARAVAEAGATLFLLLGVVAVRTRPRPRRK